MSIFIKTGRRPRSFSYEPRYYDPKREENIKSRMRIKSKSRAKRRSPAGIIFFFLLLAMAYYIYATLG